MRTLLLFLAFAALISCKTQKEPVLMKIKKGNKIVETVSSADFMAVYSKNNIHNEPVVKESLEEYLELYKNYKLKVKEAEELGLDTLPSFVSELKGYRDQLAKPYLSDQAVTDALIDEAFERMQHDIRASHILINVNKDASPADTLRGWQKATEARAKLLAGESFASVAAEYSDDPYARDIPASESSPGRQGNKGDLGFFTVFDMVYPFENAAFATQPGKISEVTRSIFGYHVMKITDKKPAMGRAFVAHIFVGFPREATTEDSSAAEKKINEIYQEYLKGEQSFEELAKIWSEDQSNANNGGVIRWFTVHGLVPEFVAVISNMEPGDVAPPVKTLYGLHIIKLLDRERPGNLEEELPNIKQRIARDSRSLKSRDEAVTKIKEQFGYKEYPQNTQEIFKYVDSTIFIGGWKFSETKMGKSKTPLFKIGNETHSVAKFGKWLETRQTRTANGEVVYFVNERLADYKNEKVLAYKERRLEMLYPEFRTLMREYRDGILLFDLMDNNVWTMAVKDTLGLQQYYEQHKHNHNWEQRVDATIFIAKTDSIARAAYGMLETDAPYHDILDTINKESALNITMKRNKYEIGDNPIIDANQWIPGVTKIFKTPEGHQGMQGYTFVVYHEVLPPAPKLLQEVRGIMISQYQEYLEKEWIQQLNNKYKVEVDETEFQKLYNRNR